MMPSQEQPNERTDRGDRPDERGRRGVGLLMTILVCIFILVVGAGVTAYIFSTEPTAQRTGATRETAMLVEVTRAEAGTFRPTIVAMGTVRPARDIILRPRISGEIVERSDAFTPGGFIQEGEQLLRIDPSDYKNTLQQRKSELQQARADLQIEMGRQNIAREEYELFDKKLSQDNRELVLREPQRNSARARVESAEAAVNQAKLDLERTSIEAPFDAQIITRDVNLGSQVSRGDRLARLVGLNTYWVEATVPLSHLQWISLPDGPDDDGAACRVRNRAAWPEGVFRQGHLYKVIGELEDDTRMARVLVEVNDPLARQKESGEAPVLMIGSYVEARIQAQKVSDVVRLERDYVRRDDTVWVMEDGRLSIRDANIVFRDSEYAYIRDGLKEGERVVTTNLTTVAEDARLRLKKDTTTDTEESGSGESDSGSPGGSS